MKECGQNKVAQVPTEDQWFEVNPKAIDLKLFQKERKDKQQERTRLLILEAVTELKANPEKYGRTFETMMPKKTGWRETVAEFKELASILGDRNADWVEQALEWAQRISNGESWEAVCNNADTYSCYRLVVWKNGYARLVGGSRFDNVYHPASYVFSCDYDSFDSVDHTVPLIVRYK